MSNYHLKYQLSTLGVTLSLMAFHQPWFFGWLMPVGMGITYVSDQL